MPYVSITKADIKLGTGNQVKIQSRGLADGLRQHPDDAVKFLEQTSSVKGLSLKDISFDDSGRVIINNLDFKNAIKEKVEGIATISANGLCANLWC